MKQDGTCTPEKALKERRGSCTELSPHTGEEISWDIKRASEAQKRVQQLAYGRQNRERPAYTALATSVYSLT